MHAPRPSCPPPPCRTAPLPTHPRPLAPRQVTYEALIAYLAGQVSVPLLHMYPSEGAKDRSLMPLAIEKIQPKQVKLTGFEPWSTVTTTHVTQDRTRHPGFLAVQLRLTCDQIHTGSETFHVKYGAKEKKRNGIIGNHVNMRDHWQATSTGLSTHFMYCS